MPQRETPHQSPAAVLKSGALNIDVDYAKCGGVEMAKLWATVAGLIAMWTGAPSVGPSKVVTGTAYDFAFSGIDGKPLKLADWRGKVLLVVNTASFCGYTKQYAGLQELWTRYEKAGLVVIGVPSNDFGGQEPKSEGRNKIILSGSIRRHLSSDVEAGGDRTRGAPLLQMGRRRDGAQGPAELEFP